jgi:predicted ribosome quality control (RQC) complex YloA/Tae2 family protein
MESEIEEGKPLSHYEALEASGQYAPQLVYGEDGALKDFYVFAVSAYAGLRSEPCPSVSAMIEKYYGEKESGNRMAQKSADLRQKIKSGLDKLYLKKQRLREDLKKAERADTYRLKGELITSNIYRLKHGMKEAELEDYSALSQPAGEPTGTELAPQSPGHNTHPEHNTPPDHTDHNATPSAGEELAISTIKIALDPLLSPSQNAQRYFKKYAKAKTAMKELAKQLDITERDISFLESYSVFLSDAVDASDLDSIREELSELGYMKHGGKNAKAKRSVKKEYLRYESASGQAIYVGRNNRENDELTLKKAKPDDLWLHTKDIPGSHVILARDRALASGFDDESVRTAACIAAHYSKARQSESVPVDYCLVKYVKKPSGAKPGMVIFTHNKTLYVTPEIP